MVFGVDESKVDKNCGGANKPVDKAALVNEHGKNKQKIVCRRCQSLIFAPNVVKLAAMGASEKCKLFWKTERELDFDTWGTQTVDGVKGGDCEFGPCGLRDPRRRDDHLPRAAERVKYI
ncbi:Mss4 protein [Aphelenchoides fujianensis]|nr:Mss4 protein [Aphelenchoides fujianensis]